MNHIHMMFHPLMELDYNHVDKENILPRNKIKLLTYNIFLRPPPIKNNENDWKDERLADFIHQLDNFDIICLQEMFGTLTSRRQEMIKYANKSGLFFFVDVPAPSFFSKNTIDAGLLILSRFPIVESEFRPFKYTIYACAICEKGILYVKFKIKDSNLIILNTHLQASYLDENTNMWEMCVKTRLSHIDEINEFIAEKINNSEILPGDTIVLLGDFNVDAHEFEVSRQRLGDKFKYKLYDEYNIMLDKLNQNFVTCDIWKVIKKFNIFFYFRKPI
jgi:endonuclease/exonuclease/phosphatase family metal-dependent hydrolase